MAFVSVKLMTPEQEQEQLRLLRTIARPVIVRKRLAQILLGCLGICFGLVVLLMVILFLMRLLAPLHLY
jgi:CBS-domain-containing membrane protein